MVRVTHGVSQGNYPVAGSAVSVVRTNLEVLFDIPEEAVALVNGELVDEEHVLLDDDDLDFLREFGSKSGLSPDEMSFLETGALPLSGAAKLFPGQQPGKKVSIDTLWRWCMRGLRNGVRLKSVLIGGRRYTTKQWVMEFIDALNQDPEPGRASETQFRTARQQQSASERAAEELRALWNRKRPAP